MEQFVQFTVDKKTAQNSGRAPGDAVGPALDAQLLLDEHKDVAQANEVCSFSAVGSAVDTGELFGKHALDDENGVSGGPDVARVGRHEGHHGNDLGKVCSRGV